MFDVDKSHTQRAEENLLIVSLEEFVNKCAYHRTAQRDGVLLHVVAIVGATDNRHWARGPAANAFLICFKAREFVRNVDVMAVS